MKKLLLFLPLALLALTVNAQQDAQFTQYSRINSAYNPGANGIKKNHHCFDFLGRSQWFGFEGAPNTALISYNGNISTLGMVDYGIGGVFMYDQIGLETNVFFKGAGSAVLDIWNGRLGIGLDLGLISKQFGSNIFAADMTDPTVATLANARSLNFDLGVGVFYSRYRKYYFGLSGQKLIPQKITWNNANPMIRPHSYVSGGYYIPVDAQLTVILNTLIKTDWTTAQYDFNVTGEYQVENSDWTGLLGIGYRRQDAITANFGLKKGQVRGGLAYDFTLNNLKNPGLYERPVNEPNGMNFQDKPNNRSRGTVELHLGYCFMVPDPPLIKKYVDPMIPFDLR